MTPTWSADIEQNGATPYLALVRRAGEWVDAAQEAGLATPPSPSALSERGCLAYLVQSADARVLTDDLCQRVVHTLTQTYYAAGEDVAEALQQALLAANEALFDHNVRADAESRLLLGVGCAVVLGRRAYLARLGPACTWIMGSEAPSQFPTRSLWYTLAAESIDDINPEPPLGLRLDVEPEFIQTTVPAGGHVALLSLALQRSAQPNELQRLLAQADVGALRQSLVAMAQQQDFSLLAWAVAGEENIAATAASGAVSGAPKAQATITAIPGIGATVRAAPIKQLNPAEEWTVAENVVQEPDQPAPSVGQRPAGAAIPATTSWNDDDEEDEFDDELDKELYDETDAAPPASAPRREHVDLTAAAEGAARGAGQALRAGAQRLRNGAEDVLLKVLPDRLPERPEPQPRKAPAVSPASQSLIIIALLLPVLVLFTVIMVRVQYNRELDSRRGSIQQTALSEYDQAINATSDELRADGLYRTMELVESGLAILPEDQLLVDLRMRTTLKLDEVESVERLYHFKRLDSYTVGGTVINQPSRIAIYDKEALVLNKGAGQVHAYTLSDVGDAVSSRAETQVALRQGQTIGATMVGELVDMTYLAATGSRTTGNFAVLDREGTLWTLHTDGFQAVPVGDSDSWLKPVAIGAYMGNLYVLDPLGGTILKYLPSENAYTTPPFPYLSSTVTVDMLGAVDMAIDGNVYVLFADGTIHKFFEGEEQAFPMTGLPSRMSNPTSIFVSGAQEPEAEGYVYVTDRGNERIVQFDKKGNYIRSFKANTSEPYMTALGGVYVDEATARMFIFSERQFVLVSLPPLTE